MEGLEQVEEEEERQQSLLQLSYMQNQVIVQNTSKEDLGQANRLMLHTQSSTENERSNLYLTSSSPTQDLRELKKGQGSLDVINPLRHSFDSRQQHSLQNQKIQHLDFDSSQPHHQPPLL